MTSTSSAIPRMQRRIDTMVIRSRGWRVSPRQVAVIVGLGMIALALGLALRGDASPIVGTAEAATPAPAMTVTPIEVTPSSMITVTPIEVAAETVIEMPVEMAASTVKGRASKIHRAKVKKPKAGARKARTKASKKRRAG